MTLESPQKSQRGSHRRREDQCRLGKIAGDGLRTTPLDRGQFQERTVRLRLVPIRRARIIAGQLVGKAVPDLHAQGTRKGERRRHVKAIDGDPAAQYVTDNTAVIWSRESTLL